MQLAATASLLFLGQAALNSWEMLLFLRQPTWLGSGQVPPLVAATYPRLVGGAIGVAGSGVMSSGIHGHQTLPENRLVEHDAVR
jgi:hypothetical protein